MKKKLAAEYATWCITDNPGHRARFSQVPKIHQAVVDWLVQLESSSSSRQQRDDALASATAAHLIYIASFSNPFNQQSFHKHGAVQALAKIPLERRRIGSSRPNDVGGGGPAKLGRFLLRYGGRREVLLEVELETKSRRTAFVFPSRPFGRLFHPDGSAGRARFGSSPHAAGLSRTGAGG